MHVSKEDRAFLKNADSYGDVERVSFLGSGSGLVIKMDDGSLQAFSGDNALDQVVNTTTKKDGKGNDVEPPVDVKTVGISILTELGIDAKNQTALFQKFMVLSKEERRNKINEWNNKKDDPTTQASFLSEILGLLEDDSLFINTQAAKLLAHIDDATRKGMLSTLNSIMTSDQRRDLIIRFTDVKNDKKQVEIFMQDLYEMLLDDETYLAMQLKVFGASSFNEPDLSEKIVKFMSETSLSYRTSIVSTWRKRQLYNNSRRSRITVKNLLKKY